MNLTPKPYRHRRATRLSYDDRIASAQRGALPQNTDDLADGELFALMHGDEPRDNSAEVRALRTATLAALGRLTDRQRSAIELHYLGGITQREIAAMWGVTPSAVCHLLDRAYARLRNLIILK